MIAQEHTKAVMAITLTKMCLELYKGDCDLALVQKAIGPCLPALRRRRLTKADQADMGKAVDVICAMVEDIWEEAGATHWGGLLWCALTFTEDVCATCPAYANKWWQKLRGALDSCAESYRLLIPEMDVAGTELYEKMAIALEGNEQKRDDPEGKGKGGIENSGHGRERGQCRV